MAEEEPRPDSVLELHEEFIRRIEESSARRRTFSIVTTLVALGLAVSYVYQLALPVLTGTKIVTIDLTDPLLEATELVLLALVLVWLYIAVRDFLFTRRMTEAIREARAAERVIERRVAA